ncbi:hypothetical protein Tco_0694193 [Tanacetum coccineum]
MGIMTRTEVSGRREEARGRRMILPRKYSRDTNLIIYKCRKHGQWVRTCPNGPAKKEKENTAKTSGSELGSELTLLAGSELKTSELDTSELKTSEYRFFEDLYTSEL